MTSMYGMFWRATWFNQPLDSWDVSKVTDTGNMFREAASFNQPLNGWTTTSLESTRSMFTYAEAFNQPLDKWDTSALTAMDSVNAPRPSTRTWVGRFPRTARRPSRSSTRNARTGTAV